MGTCTELVLSRLALSISALLDGTGAVGAASGRVVLGNSNYPL
ncbi:hypothetical protein [Nostoc sp.]